jgi:hypothetical protein
MIANGRCANIKVKLSIEAKEIVELAETVPWGSIRKQVGFCEGIPEVLRGLTSPDPAVCEQSYWQIDNSLIVQNDLHEGAFYVAPFLVALLRTECIIGRTAIYGLLDEISRGAATGSEFVHFTTRPARFPFYVPQPGGEEVLLRVACRNAVASGIHIYLEEVASVKSPARTTALDLLENFVEHGPLIICCLEPILASEADEAFCNQLRAAIQELRMK